MKFLIIILLMSSFNAFGSAFKFDRGNCITYPDSNSSLVYKILKLKTSKNKTEYIVAYLTHGTLRSKYIGSKSTDAIYTEITCFGMLK